MYRLPCLVRPNDGSGPDRHVRHLLGDCPNGVEGLGCAQRDLHGVDAAGQQRPGERDRICVLDHHHWDHGPRFTKSIAVVGGSVMCVG